MSALETLVARYEAPVSGGVGYVGADIPRELVEGAGLSPVRLRGTGPADPLAESILGSRVDPPIRRILAALLRGELPIDFLLLGHDSDSSVRLHDALRRLSPHDLPELWFVDLLHLPTETTGAYNVGRLRELVAVLERWSGQPVTDESLRAAIREANRTRTLLAQLAALRRDSPPRLSGTDALAVIGATTMLPAAESNAQLEQLLAGDCPAVPAVRRVYVTGSSHDTLDLYRAIESDGSVIVGEDHDWGEALAGGLVDEHGDPLAAIAARYRSGSATAIRHETTARAGHVAREAVAARADVVVSWIRTGDDALGWGLPALRRALDARGIRLVAAEQRGPGAESAAELAPA
jgi:benzoyl-CoA reductase/2-hydroxyglutaryl-CoA dehydratase subunit BcrC/BadD/HgdB